METNKAPSPDGFTVDLYHHCWPFLKDEAWWIMNNSQKTIGVLSAFISTFLTLVPKANNVADPKDFHPISLCNVIYKIITKFTASHLKPLIPMLVSIEQTSYVEGGQIMDSIILDNEIIYSLKHTNSQSMIIKLDFSKAFDKLR